MELVLVRHAEPDWVQDGRAVNDPGLTVRGHRQAAAVAARLAAEDAPDEVLVSPARRSQETCTPIAAAVDPNPDTHDWLHEIRRPDGWDGRPIEEITPIWKAARRAPMDQRWDPIDTGAESMRDFHARIGAGLVEELASRGVVPHPSDPDLWTVPDDTPRIIVVAHAGTNAVLLSHLLGLDPVSYEWDRFWCQHASITRLSTTRIADGHVFSLRAFSDVAHLAKDDVTA